MESAPTIQLPIEVWEKVFHHSRAEDAWNFRLVCKAWRKELDDHFDKWAVRLHQTSPYFQHVLQLKVREARILALSSPVDIMGQEGLFKRPELLEKLTIRNDCNIRPENLLLLLNSSGKTIKHLYIAGIVYEGVLSDPSYNRHPNGFEFANLESLKLFLTSCPRGPIQQLTLFKLMVALSKMTKIKSLTVAIADHCIDAVSSTVLGCIEKNGTNLEVIDFWLLNPDSAETLSGQHQLQAQPIDLALLKQVLRLKKLHIHYPDREIPITCVSGWSTLLKAQMNLTDLNLRSLPISPRILRLVCHNNETALTKVVLGYLDFDIDAGILAGCMHLKEVRVFRDYEDDHHMPGQPVLRNARRLPVGIQTFQSGNYLIESADILDLFVGHGELVEFTLENTGCAGLYGVTAAVLSHFVNNRDLSNKLGDMKIESFNCSTAENLTDLNEIVRGLDCLKPQAWVNKNVNKNNVREFSINLNRTKGDGDDWSVWVGK